MKTLTYKTIEYIQIDNSSRDVCLIFPPANSYFQDFVPLLDCITKNLTTDVLLVMDGYFGIGARRSKDKLLDYNRQSFLKNFNELFYARNYENVFIIAESVGCLHAVDFLHTNKIIPKKLIMLSPAYYKGKGIARLLHLSLLNTFLTLPSTGATERIVQLFANISNQGIKGVVDYLKFVKTITGKESLLLCFKEIIHFSMAHKTRFEQALLGQSSVLVGKGDAFFKHLCDEKVCSVAGPVKKIDAPHSIIRWFPAEFEQEVLSLRNL